jgi:predicted enzyme related to lactoylglutathione lyase
MRSPRTWIEDAVVVDRRVKGFTWMDVTSTDVMSSRNFYTKLFTWLVRPLDLETAPGYALFLSGEEVVAGIDPITVDKGPPAWTMFVDVHDIDRTAAVAAACGGTVSLTPVHLGELGVIAMIVDPRGATVGLWQSGALSPRAGMHFDGSLVEAALVTPDPAAAVDFYAQCFGWKATQNSLRELRVDNTRVRVRIRASSHTENSWTPILGSPDVEAARLLALSLGGRTVAQESDEFRDGHVRVADPLGAEFVLAPARTAWRSA